MRQNNEDCKIVLIKNTEHLNQIAEIHQLAFSNVLSGTIGKRFLKYYYKRIIEKGFIFVCFIDNHIAGFVSGITDEGKFYNIKFYLYAMWGIITHIYSYKAIINLIRYIKRSINLYTENYTSELLSIVVLDNYRGKGIGKQLVKTFDDFMVKNGIEIYKVFTDMEFSTGYKLYDKLGFSLHRELNLFGLTLRMYLRRLKNG